MHKEHKHHHHHNDLVDDDEPAGEGDVQKTAAEVRPHAVAAAASSPELQKIDQLLKVDDLRPSSSMFRDEIPVDFTPPTATAAKSQKKEDEEDPFKTLKEDGMTVVTSTALASLDEDIEPEP